MKNKISTIFFILIIILSSTVFAANTQISKIDSDINENSKNYILNSEVYGNVFLVTDNFEMSDNSSILGDLFLKCETAQIKSNVSYSSAISKDGSYAIETVYSKAIINGNVYIICDEFTLEPGAEINGDLYIIANKITIQKSSSIYGNLFAVSSEILLDGRVDKSVYAISNNFNMNYYGTISKDLFLTSENVTLSSVIHRNAYINSKIITINSDFLLYGNLETNSHEFNFSGQIDGDAKINSKKINFINTRDGDKINCLISGTLNYSTEEELQIEDDIIKGETNYSEYVEKIDTKPTFKFSSFILNLFTFTFYILAVVLVFNLINKNYKKMKHNITIKNILSSFGIGLLSFIIVAIVLLLLILIQIGVTLSFALLFAYLFLLFMVIPIFILDIALLFKEKFNIYLSTAIIALALSIISAIPVVGTIVMFIFMITGVRKNLY